MSETFRRVDCVFFSGSECLPGSVPFADVRFQSWPTIVRLRVAAVRRPPGVLKADSRGIIQVAMESKPFEEEIMARYRSYLWE